MIDKTYITYLTALGQKLQIAMNALDEAENTILDTNLDDSFTDGQLTGQIGFLTSNLSDMIENVKETLAAEIGDQAQEQAQAILVNAAKDVEKAQSGETFGDPNAKSACTSCDEEDCALRTAPYQINEVLTNEKK